MPRALRILLGVVTAVVAVGAVTFLWKNPEKRTLDAAARTMLPGKFVQLSQGITHFEDSGPEDARVVILAHGASVPLYIWDSTAVALANAGFRVIRYDRYGFGYSDRPNVAYDSTMFVRQLDELANALGLSMPFDLMGLSFGGFVTAQYVQAHPDRVRTLTLVDPVATSSSAPWYLRAASATPLLREWFWQVVAVPAAANGQSGDFLHPEHFPGWVDRYRPQLVYRGVGRAMQRTRSSAAHVDYKTLYEKVGQSGVPVMLIWGKQDPVVAFSNSAMIRAAIPSVNFLPVDSSGHLPHMEQSSFVHERMLVFLKAHPPRSHIPPPVATPRGPVASFTIRRSPAR